MQTRLLSATVAALFVVHCSATCTGQDEAKCKSDVTCAWVIDKCMPTNTVGFGCLNKKKAECEKDAACDWVNNQCTVNAGSLIGGVCQKMPKTDCEKTPTCKWMTDKCTGNNVVVKCLTKKEVECKQDTTCEWKVDQCTPGAGLIDLVCSKMPETDCEKNPTCKWMTDKCTANKALIECPQKPQAACEKDTQCNWAGNACRPTIKGLKKFAIDLKLKVKSLTKLRELIPGIRERMQEKLGGSWFCKEICEVVKEGSSWVDKACHSCNTPAAASTASSANLLEDKTFSVRGEAETTGSDESIKRTLTTEGSAIVGSEATFQSADVSPNNDDNDDNTTSGSDKLSTGAIIGIVIGCTVGLGLISGLAFYLCRKSDKAETNKAAPDAAPDAEDRV